MQDITTIDICVVAAACVAAWFIGKGIKKKQDREYAEAQEKMNAQAETAAEPDVEE